MIGERVVAAPVSKPAIDDLNRALPQVASAEAVEHQNVHEQGGEGAGLRLPARDGVALAREACRLSKRKDALRLDQQRRITR